MGGGIEYHEVEKHYIFIPRCEGLVVHVVHPVKTTNQIDVKLVYNFPDAVLNVMKDVTSHNITYIQKVYN